MARDRKQLHLRRTGENRRVRRPTLREALREADRRARQRANQRSWRRRGLTAKQSAIAGTHALFQASASLLFTYAAARASRVELVHRTNINS